jgi:catechol 2,3-dioxygenase-like lactoylglutathione lyase family enzyme
VNHPRLPPAKRSDVSDDRTMKPLPASHLRIARPSHDLQASERFWVDGLGLDVLFRAGSSAEGGHALLMVGWPDAAWHLELVSDRAVKRQPRRPRKICWCFISMARSMRALSADWSMPAAHGSPARNPYWDHGGVTIADPDGYRLVLTGRSWP